YAEIAFLAMFTPEHLADGVEGDADDEDYRNQEQRQHGAPGRINPIASRKRECERSDGNLIGRDAAGGKCRREGTQPLLESRLQRMDGHHVSALRDRSRSSGDSVSRLPTDSKTSPKGLPKRAAGARGLPSRAAHGRILPCFASILASPAESSG